jgi:hypothetical protein
MYILSESLTPHAVANRNPKPIPMYARPLIPVLKWYTPEKRSGRKMSVTVLVVLGDIILPGKVANIK